MIDLYTATTPNGWKVSIALEEMGIAYKTHLVDLFKNQQKEDWFQAINPNGRVPAIIDQNNDNFAVFESGAILIYLAERAGMFMGSDAKQRSTVVQWLMFQMAGVGPMMGQASVFIHYAPEKIPYAIDRYRRECQRLLKVLDSRLEHSEYLAGDYSIADMANFSWVHTYFWNGLSIENLPHLKRWLAAIGTRPPVKKGLAVPYPVKLKSDDNSDLISIAQKILI